MSKGFRLSDKELDALLQQGQHSILYCNSLSLNLNPDVEPGTGGNKPVKTGTRTRLQDAFFNTWVMVGGGRDYWITEYKFHPDRKWRFDFANPDDRIAVEVNGGQWFKSGHSSGHGLQRDAEKQNAALSLGWQVFTLTTSMLSKREAADNVVKIMEVVYGSKAG